MIKSFYPCRSFKIIRPTGVEPIFPAPEAGALSIELRAHYDDKLYFYYTKNRNHFKNFEANSLLTLDALPPPFLAAGKDFFKQTRCKLRCTLMQSKICICAGIAQPLLQNFEFRGHIERI